MYEKKTAQQTLELLKSNGGTGLSAKEAENRVSVYGTNTLVTKKKKSIISMIIGQLNEPMVYILFAAAAISAGVGIYESSVSGKPPELVDVFIILAVIAINTVIGVMQENKAENALGALKQLAAPRALVKRDGVVTETAAAELVPGDIVVLEAGRVIPADMRLVSSANLKIDESALTGESVATEKDASFYSDEDIPIGDRRNMAYMSTAVTYGRGEGVVTATGMATEIGRIAVMLENEAEGQTPLQVSLAGLSKKLGILALGVCALMFAVGAIWGMARGAVDGVELLMSAIALAVAAIPEGLTAIVTIVLALGVTRMVKASAIVRRLPAVEALGSVNVICSDKTGTLTQNRMTVRQFYYDEALLGIESLSFKEHLPLIQGFTLCTDAVAEEGARSGDPTELALLDMAASVLAYKKDIEGAWPRVDELPFDSDRKMMTTVHRRDEELYISFTKGAVDSLLPRCTKIISEGAARDILPEDIEKIDAAAGRMSTSALRVLALGMRNGSQKPLEEELIFVGLVGMIDPPRPEVINAVKSCHDAGIKVVMITGDHKDTALAIARELGIAKDTEEAISGAELDTLGDKELIARAANLRVYARVSPSHKVRIVKAIKRIGGIVSMTGDGVNDAPSLKAADIGVAMGVTGTDVAKEAADMVLTDDNFATIERAVAEGRNIYRNIKKSVYYLLSSNLGEIVTMFTAALLGLPLPLRPVHVLWVNLVTDSMPALALGMDTPDPDIMSRPPRSPGESLFAGGGWRTIITYGSFIGLITLGAFSLGRSAGGIDEAAAVMRGQTYAFIVLSVSQLFNALCMKSLGSTIFNRDTLKNKKLFGALALGLLLQAAVVSVPPLAKLFGTMTISLREWLMLVTISAAPLFLHELSALVRYVSDMIGRGRK